MSEYSIIMGISGGQIYHDTCGGCDSAGTDGTKECDAKKSVLVMLEKTGWALSAKTLHFIPTGGSTHHTCASNIMDDMG